MKSLIKTALAGALILGASIAAQAETSIKVTLQLPATHSLGKN